MRYRIGLLCCLFFYVDLAFAQPLAQNPTYKLAIPKTGIYRINRSLLREMGVNPEEIDPRRIRIWSAEGGMLPQANSAPRSGLVELPIYVQGEQDGRFDANDFIVFYAQGADKIWPDAARRQIRHEKNLYDDYNYCFLSIDATNGKRISQQSLVPETNAVISDFQTFFYHEKDDFNLVSSGRRWFGERFDIVNEHTIRFPANGWISGTSIQIQSAVMAQSVSPTTFSWQLNGQDLGSRQMAVVPAGTYARRGTIAEVAFSLIPTLPAGTNEFVVRIRYDRAGNHAAFGHLDYLTLSYQRRLQLYENPTLFRSFAATEQTTNTFRIAAATADLQVWDITDVASPQVMRMRFSGNEAFFSAANPQRQLREYAIFRTEGLPEPRFVGIVAPQNLRETTPRPELLIVAAPPFLPAAQRLAEFRRQHDGLQVEVVSTEQVYNEFSSGRKDLTAIRDFVRHRYLQPQSQLQYLLLFGDASYDYKDRTPNNTNFVPVYQSYESLHPIFSFSSDDYFGFLDEHEGTWEEDFGGAYNLEIGIGRLPVKTAREAAAVVDKLIYYTTAATLGEWRRRIVFVADDGDFNVHLTDSEQLSTLVQQRSPSSQIKKIYIDAFPQVATPTGRRSPQAREALNRQIAEGALIVNYTGHGSETGWASEAILDVVSINNWTNYDRLPLMITATCEFGRYDNPFLTSGAEYALLNPRGGAIALITTTRPVFSSTNFILNEAFYKAVFASINGRMPRLGDIQRQTKNNSINGVVNRNFALLGDPSMQLALPQQQITFTNAPDTLKALANVVLTGEVQQQGNLDANFNGLLQIEVMDKEFEMQTLGDEDAPAMYRDRPSVLFRGLASVRQGRFSVQFTVPKNINYVWGKGKIYAYAMDNNRNADAAGVWDAIVGGTTTNIIPDNTPPQIRLFMDSEQFQNGGSTRPDTELLAFFQDDTGINISRTGIGHDIVATLDERQTFILNDLYGADIDNPRKGSLRLPLKGLEKGEHRIHVKAWDLHNNPAEATIRFWVEEEPLQITDVKVFPNPVTSHTDVLRWQFTHNRTGSDFAVSVVLYDLMGRKIAEQQTELYNVRQTQIEILQEAMPIELRDLAKGAYLYQVIIESLSGGKEKARFFGRVIVMR
ncbi:MAG: type IX secretion system sortase PorU [Cytophagales bacterium]|nr:type IX secretion system sortase PorU [Bernardetiaceae bacterium]MDW8205386.1 type IX secretion system sortase PorU [Cytophagales bacterium]